jgi:signal transduction histidine kinase
MGLNIVKSIVDMYNGRIEVDSHPERGVRILVELPR